MYPPLYSTVQLVVPDLYLFDPGDVVISPLPERRGTVPKGPQDVLCGVRARQANEQASKRAQHVDRPLVKRPMRGPANSVTHGSEFLWGVDGPIAGVQQLWSATAKVQL